MKIKRTEKKNITHDVYRLNYLITTTSIRNKNGSYNYFIQVIF